ncbi:MAG: DUF4270 domain-containing protein [Chitinophagales bacterium]
MKKHIATLGYGILLGCLALLNGCKDPVIEDNSITNHAGDDLNLAHVDSFTVYAFSNKETSLPSYKVTQAFIGSINDPIFGKSWSSIYAQVLLPNLNMRFPGAIVDSVVLSMPYNSKFGKFSVPLDLAVYELSQYLDPSSTSYTNLDAFTVFGSPIGRQMNYVPNVIDSVNVNGVNYAPQLRIRLNDAVGTKLLSADSTSAADNANFLQYFKGFYLTSNTSVVGDGVANINIDAAGIIVYYHSATVTPTSITFPVTSSSQTLNHIDHNYAGAPVEAVFNTPHTSTGNDVMYIQSGAGINGTILIPFLQGDNFKKIAVNKAELILTMVEDPTSLDTILSPPPGLILRTLDAFGTPTDIPSGIDRQGVGTLSQTVENGKTVKRYIFTLTNLVQKIANGTAVNHGFTVGYSFAQRQNRVVINHKPTDPEHRIKLRITYTKL